MQTKRQQIDRYCDAAIITVTVTVICLFLLITNNNLTSHANVVSYEGNKGGNMPKYESTSMSLNEDDVVLREACMKAGISLIDAWRYGANQLLNGDDDNKER